MSSLVQANVTFQGSITSLGTFGQTTYAPVDLGVNSLSLKTGNLTSLVTTTSSAPTGFAEAGEGALVFPGTANSYISFGPQVNVNFTLASATATFEAWFYPTGSLGGTYAIYSHASPNSGNYDWTMYIETNNKIGFYSPSPNFTIYSTNTVNFNAWNHVAWSFSGGTIYIALNGVVNTGNPGSTQFTSTHSLLVGANGNLGTTISLFNGYMTNLRIVQGAALYTAAYTVPTAPLQIATSGTTRLLVRVPLAPGKMVVPKLGGQNCNTVLAFPPAPMTGYATNMTGQSYYGQGVYVASASSEYQPAGTNPAWKGFSKAVVNGWSPADGQYSGTPGTYQYSNVTVDITGTSYRAEWIQIQMPSSILLSNYSITNGNATGNSPYKWWLFGSRDGVNWYLIDSQSNISWSALGTKTFAVGAAHAHTYFRLAVNQVQGSLANPVIGDVTFNGTIEGPSISADGRLGVGVTTPTQALEVAGSALVAGTLSAGNPITFKNRIINGDGRIAQRSTSSSAANYSSIDRWNMNMNGGNITLATSSSVPLGQGFSNSLSLTINTTIAGGTVGAWYMNQKIEGYNVSDFGLGTATGQPFTVSFWLQSSLTGNLSIFFQNSAEDRSYVTSISVGAVNSWTKYTITVPPVASGTWYNNNLTGITMGFGFYSIYNTGTLNAWVNSGAYWLNNATNYMVSGTTIQITGLQLEKGSVATPFEVRPFATELALCMRYYEKSYANGVAPGTAGAVAGFFQVTGSTEASGACGVSFRYSVPKRIIVTPTFYNHVTGASNQWYVIRNGIAATSAVPTSAGYNSEYGSGGYVIVGAATAWVPCYIAFQWVADAEL